MEIIKKNKALFSILMIIFVLALLAVFLFSWKKDRELTTQKFEQKTPEEFKQECLVQTSQMNDIKLWDEVKSLGDNGYIDAINLDRLEVDIRPYTYVINLMIRNFSCKLAQEQKNEEDYNNAILFLDRLDYLDATKDTIKKYYEKIYLGEFTTDLVWLSNNVIASDLESNCEELTEMCYFGFDLTEEQRGPSNLKENEISEICENYCEITKYQLDNLKALKEEILSGDSDIPPPTFYKIVYKKEGAQSAIDYCKQINSDVCQRRAEMNFVHQTKCEHVNDENVNVVCDAKTELFKNGTLDNNDTCE